VIQNLLDKNGAVLSGWRFTRGEQLGDRRRILIGAMFLVFLVITSRVLALVPDTAPVS